MRRVLLIVSLVLTARLYAGEATPVPDTAKWIVHLNFQRIMGELAPLMAEIKAKPEVIEGANQIELISGIKIFSDIHQATIFGEDASEEKTVIAVNGNFDKEKLTALVKNADKHKVITFAGRNIHTWHDTDKNKDPYACLAAPNLLLVGNSDEMLRRCIDALDGRTPAGAIGSDLNTVDTVLFCAVRDLQSLQGADPKAAILQKVTELRAHIDSKDKKLVAALEAKTLDSAAAKNIKSIVEGLRALVALNAQEDKETAVLLEHLTIQAEGELVRVAVDVSDDAATAWIEQRVKESSRKKSQPGVLATPAPRN
jgi:hypothetical protein